MKASLLKRVSLSMPRWEWILIIILLVLNLFLKLLGIGDETIYGDEAYSISVSARPLNFIVENFKADQNPPLYFILLHYWIKLTGVNDVSLKLLSVIFIMLCSVFLYFFARKHLSREAAIFTLLLFTFSNGQEFFSREIRGYALSLFLAVISCNLYFNILEKPRKRIAAALAIANLLLLYTHYLTIFIPFLQAVFSFFRYHKNRRGFIFFWISQIAALLVFIPWIGIVIKNMPAEGNFWITQPDWIALKVTVMELLGSSLLRDIFIVLLACMLLTFLAALRFRKILNSMDPWKFLFLFSLQFLIPRR